MRLFTDIKALLQGLGIAGKHLGRHAVTIQYPEERWEMPERSRGIVVLLSDQKTGELNCTACQLCERACPSAAIRIDAPRDPETKKKDLKSFEIDFSLCCFCGLCVEACNFCAIKMTGKYEFSVLDKKDLIWDVKKLQEMGRDVPYIDTRKKKKPAAKKEAPAKKDEQPAAAANPTEGESADKPAEKATEAEGPVEEKPAGPDQPAGDKTEPDDKEAKA